MIRDDMMRRMTASEFREWWAFYRWEHRQKTTESAEQTPEDMLKVLDG